MGFALILIGLLMVVTGGRGTYAQFGSQIASEFTGTPNFGIWIIAIGTIGAVGYIQKLQTISRLLMTLILLSIFLSHKGFFAQFQAALKAGPKAPNALASQTAVSPTASTATINSAISSNTSGATGQPATSTGQATFNGWMNYLFGTSTNSSAGATQ
jgi:hypothetical protein